MQKVTIAWNTIYWVMLKHGMTETETETDADDGKIAGNTKTRN